MSPSADFLKMEVDDETTERAEAAVKAFRSMQPTLTSYARALTGRKDIRVEVATRDNGSTDGQRIFYRPPIALGDRTPHDRSLCSKRDASGHMTCPACRVRESVLVTIYHEIAHVCFDSFERTTDADKRQAINFAIKETGGKWAEQIAERIENSHWTITSSYMGLARLINEYLPFLVNCLEDARVNRELFKARKGVKAMFYADTVEVFEHGFEVRDERGILKTVQWSEAPLNSQAMIGCFVKASGYNYTGWFHPDVEEALNDEKLTDLIGGFGSIRSAGAVFNLSFKVLARLRELGFCGTPQDPDPEPESEPEEEQESEPEQEQEEEEEESDEGNEEADSEGESEGSSEEEEADESSDHGDSDSSEVERDGDGADDSDSEPEGDETEDQGHRGGAGESDDSEEESGDGDDSASGDGDLDEESPAEGSSDSDSVPDDAEPQGGASSDNDADGEPESGGDSDDTADGTPGDSVEGESEGSGGGDDSEEGELDDSSEAGLSSGSPGHTESGSDSGSGESDQGQPQSHGEAEGSELDESGPKPEGAPEGSDDSSPEPLGEVTSEQDEAEEVDTGADDGYGGTEVRKENQNPRPEMGTPDEVAPVLKKFGSHEEKPKSIAEQTEENAVERAIIQGVYFTKPSKNIFGVRVHEYGKPIIEDGYNYSMGWDKSHLSVEVEIPESILGSAVTRTRRAFTDNQVGRNDRNRKSGRVNKAVLGRRAWNDDERLFQKKTQPGKKDYAVVIGMDISGSTVGKNLRLEKRAIMAQAEVLNRTGVDFAIYAHSGNYQDARNPEVGMTVEMYVIKELGEPWTNKTRERLTSIRSTGINIDGHALEFLRKQVEKSRATDKIVMYYSDGKMPAENHDEELEVLRHEIKHCKSHNIVLLGVGIRTDSPRRHGLDTVQVDEDADLNKVVKHLSKRLSTTTNR